MVVLGLVLALALSAAVTAGAAAAPAPSDDGPVEDRGERSLAGGHAYDHGASCETDQDPSGRERIENRTEHPYSAIAHVQAEDWEDPGATAFLVEPDVAVTAGHVVAPGGEPESSTIRIYPGRENESRPYGAAEVTDIWVHEEFDGGAEDRAYDVAVLELNESIGAETGTFDYRAAALRNYEDVALTGYPWDLPGTTMWEDVGPLYVNTEAPPHRYSGQHAGCPGNSGSPFWTTMDGEPTAFGVVTDGPLNAHGTRGTGISNETIAAIEERAGPDCVAVDGREVCSVRDDGQFRDFNADGTVTQADVTEFFSVQHRSAYDRAEFDYNDNGSVGLDDVVALFQAV